MSRGARIKSESGIYHIMLRGINHQQIFEEEADNYKFIEILKKYKEICEYKLYAYCLMGNHVHILLQEGSEKIHQVMKRIAGKYVYWFNTKYQRTGHLFQDRFKSEPVNDERYLLTVIRYIHQNPLKENLVTRLDNYPYSSYKEYITGSEFVDIEFAVELMGKDRFVEFHNQFNNDKCIDITEKAFRITDEEAKKLIYKFSKCKTASEFQTLSAEKRNAVICKLKENRVSIRQINRLTGISKGIIEKL